MTIFYNFINATIFFLIICICTQKAYAQSKLQSPKKYIAFHTTERINIDGKVNEMAWNNAAWTDSFVDIYTKVLPLYNTRVKIIFDDDYLYFFADIEEPHIWANLKQRDTVVFHNNDFEIFLNPTNDTYNYFEFEVNALNTVWDLFLSAPYRDAKNFVLNNWDIKGLKSAVHIEGTINNPLDIDKKWSVEIAMPWSALLETSKNKNIPIDTFWRVNFSRVNWQYDTIKNVYSKKKDLKTKQTLPEYNWVWSPQRVIAMHEPEYWGYLYFKKNKK